jgi:hypothetical protein
MSSDKEPALVRMGANEREAPSKINLNVSGAPGPDYLGQETKTVDGHPCDRPGVRSRLPESSAADDPRIARMDTGEELPVLLESDMRADPCEAVQGSYTHIVEGVCARCGYDRLKESVTTLAGERRRVCNACGAIQDRRGDDGYRMPTTRKERAEMKREAGPTLGRLTNSSVVDLEPDTGYGPMVCLARDRSFRSLYKDDVADLFWMLVENGDLDIIEQLRDNLRQDERCVLAASQLPDSVTLAADDGTEE